MGLIREPEGVDLYIAPHEVSEEDIQITIAAIAASKERLNARFHPALTDKMPFFQ